MPDALPTPMLPTTLPEDMPLLYEDEEEGEMGETNLHSTTGEILHVGWAAHFAPQPRRSVFINMNFYYHPHDRKAYVSPDVMVVETLQPLPKEVTSYRLNVDGPVPLLTTEILSERTAQQDDLDKKVKVYAQLQIPEYVLVDVTGEHLPELLLLKRLQPDGTYRDEQDSDGGITSQYGFRLVVEEDGQVRVVDAATGRRYVRPHEAEARVRELETAIRAEAKARRIAAREQRAQAIAREQLEAQLEAEATARKEAEERLRQVEAELARLRSQGK